VPWLATYPCTGSTEELADISHQVDTRDLDGADRVVEAPSGIPAQAPELIIPAPTVTPVPSSIRMNEPVVRFFE